MYLIENFELCVKFFFTMWFALNFTSNQQHINQY